MTAGQGRATLKSLWFHGAYLKDKFQTWANGSRCMEKWKRRATKGAGCKIVQPQFEILSDPDTRARRKIGAIPRDRPHRPDL